MVALLNLAYAAVEMAMALAIGSVSLFADCVDFLEDTAINALVFFSLTRTDRIKQKAGFVLSFIILVPAAAPFATAVYKAVCREAPEPFTLTGTAAGAMAVNLVCALLLIRLRRQSTAEGGSLIRGAWLAARNDVFADILIMAAGCATFFRPVAWWDITAGIIIAVINFHAFKEVFTAAKHEGDPLELLEEEDG